jgi:hypothetical protein
VAGPAAIYSGSPDQGVGAGGPGTTAQARTQPESWRQASRAIALLTEGQGAVGWPSPSS